MAALDPTRRECIETLDKLHTEISAGGIALGAFDFNRASGLLREVGQKWSGSICFRDGHVEAIKRILTLYATCHGNSFAHLSMAIARMRRVIAWPAESVDGAAIAGDLSTIAGALDHAAMHPDLPRQVLVRVCERVGALPLDAYAMWDACLAIGTGMFLSAATSSDLARLVRNLAAELKAQTFMQELEPILSGAMGLTRVGTGAGGSQNVEPVVRAFEALIVRWGSEFPAVGEARGLIGELGDLADSACHHGIRLLLAAQRVDQAVPTRNAMAPCSRQEAADAVQEQIDFLPRDRIVQTGRWDTKKKYLEGICRALARLPFAEERRMHRHLTLVAPAIFDTANVEELQSIGARLVDELRRVWFTERN